MHKEGKRGESGVGGREREVERGRKEGSRVGERRGEER